MKKSLLFVLSSVLLSCSTETSLIMKNDTDVKVSSLSSIKYKDNEFIIKLNKGVLPETYAKSNKLTLLNKIGLDMYIFKTDTPLNIEYLKRDKNVKFVEKNKIISLPKLEGKAVDFSQIKKTKNPITNDPLIDAQYAITITGADKAWKAQKGKAEVIVSVIDSGVDGSHPEFEGQLLQGFDLTVNPPIIGGNVDKYGHGTHVAGVIAAKSDNGIGISGIASGCKILPVRIFDDFGHSTEGISTQAVIWAVDHGAKVINASWGSPIPGEAFKEAVKYALNKDVVFVAAVGNAGNNDPDNIAYPSASPGVIGVAATTDIDGWASFSTYGDQVDLGAPGKGILSTYPLSLGNGYRIMEGTSMATPVVTAAVALVRSQFPSLTQAQVKDKLERTAKDTIMTGHDQYVGFGRVDIGRAVLE